MKLAALLICLVGLEKAMLTNSARKYSATVPMVVVARACGAFSGSWAQQYATRSAFMTSLNEFAMPHIRHAYSPTNLRTLAIDTRGSNAVLHHSKHTCPLLIIKERIIDRSSRMLQTPERNASDCFSQTRWRNLLWLGNDGQSTGLLQRKWCPDLCAR